MPAVTGDRVRELDERCSRVSRRLQEHLDAFDRVGIDRFDVLFVLVAEGLLLTTDADGVARAALYASGRSVAA